MKKILWAVCIGLLLLGVVAVFWIDSLARLAVEKGANAALGVPVTLSSLRIGLFSGEAGLSELTVKNPPGFSGPHFFRLDAGELALSLGSVFSDRVRIPKIRLRGIDLALEQAGSETNLGAILKNLDRGATASAPSGQDAQPAGAPEPESPGKRFLVEEISIEEIRVAGTLQVPGLGPKTISYQIPQILLRDVGSDSAEGVSMVQLSSQIVKAILKGAIEQGKDLPKEFAEQWRNKRDELRDSWRKQGEDLKKQADDLKDLLRKKKD